MGALDQRFFGHHGDALPAAHAEIDPCEESWAQGAVGIVDLRADAQRSRLGIDGGRDELHDALEALVRPGAHFHRDLEVVADPMGVQFGHAELDLQRVEGDEFEEGRALVDELTHLDGAPRDVALEGGAHARVCQGALGHAECCALRLAVGAGQQQGGLGLFELLSRGDALFGEFAYPVGLAPLLPQLGLRLGESRLCGVEVELAALRVDLDYHGAGFHRAALLDADLRDPPLDLRRDVGVVEGLQLAAGADLFHEIHGTHHGGGNRGPDLDLGGRFFPTARQRDGAQCE